MKKLIRSSVLVLGMSLAGTAVTPLFAMPQQQDRDQNRDRDDQTRDRDDQNRQMQDRDQNRDRDDQNRDHDQMKDRDHRVSNMGDEDRYHNNRYYKMGWQDGEHHKHKNNRKFDNDDDRQAYEAGYMRGDRGEKWQNHPKDRDHDHDNDHDRR